MQNLWARITKTMRRFDINPFFLDWAFGFPIDGKSRVEFFRERRVVLGEYVVYYRGDSCHHGYERLPLCTKRYSLAVTVRGDLGGNVIARSKCFDVDLESLMDEHKAERLACEFGRQLIAGKDQPND